MQGRKRHVLVDTMGNLLAVLILAADVSDRDGAELLLQICYARYPWLRTIWADGSYEGDLETDLPAWYEIDLVIVSKLADQEGFFPLPKRWIVERTLAWITQGRRLVRDYERNPSSSEAWVWIAAIHRTVKYLMPDKSLHAPYRRRNAA